jgi:thiosulfate/3-mercaptopyruvate sulfurtransferase
LHQPLCNGASVAQMRTVIGMDQKVLLETPELLQRLQDDDVVLIDTREPEKFKSGHIPGAVNIHEIFTFLSSSTPEGMEDLRMEFRSIFGEAGLSGKELAVVYEQSMDTGLGQSCRGYFLLKFLGYPRAGLLHGGLDAWVGHDQPVTRQATPPSPKTFPTSDAGDHLIINQTEMLAALENPDIVKLDVRDVEEWMGLTSSPYGIDFSPRKGRIPGSRWLEWYCMMKPGSIGPVFKNTDEILAECRTVGITQDTPVILYCFKGARTSNTFVALKEAGIRNVRNYFGSWNEWSQDQTLPIDEGQPRRDASGDGEVNPEHRMEQTKAAQPLEGARGHNRRAKMSLSTR